MLRMHSVDPAAPHAAHEPHQAIRPQKHPKETLLPDAEQRYQTKIINKKILFISSLQELLKEVQSVPDLDLPVFFLLESQEIREYLFEFLV